MLAQLFNDKSLKPKERTEQLAAMLLSKELSADALLEYAARAKDPIKATCVEAIEFATLKEPAILPAAQLDMIIDYLEAKAPRIKWESAKVIANTIHLHPKKVDVAVLKLLANTDDSGTVVRWSAAFALAQILKMKTGINAELAEAAQAISDREEKNSIKKIYQEALKKIK